MNANVRIDGLTSLRRVDPDEAALVQALCRLLEGQLGAPADSATWFEAGEGLHFHIARIAGQAVPLSSDRISDAIAALDRVDPILIKIEGALGVSMDAAAIGDKTPDALIVLVHSNDDDIHLAIPRDHPRAAGWIEHAATMPPRDAHTPCLIHVEAVGPRLTIADASNLNDGDLLLIPNQTAATLIAAHIAPVVGMIDLTTGIFSAGQNGASMPDDTPATEFMVPLTIRLPDRMTSAASLSSLVPGTTLPLGPLTEGMSVELRVADRLLARGELVQLGDRFAVLIESRADIADPVSEVTD